MQSVPAPTRANTGPERQKWLLALAERVQEIECRGRADPVVGRPAVIPFPSASSGAVLTIGAVHEWFGQSDDGPRWTPPLTLLAHLARRAVEARADSGGGLMVWVGRRCWAHPRAFDGAADQRLWRRCLFVDAPDPPAALWAADLALRSPAVAAVVADAGGMDMSSSRRLQLAARDGGTLGLFARPATEQSTQSAAATRWSVAPTFSPGTQPRWTVELLRCKGLRPQEGPRRWAVERDHAQGLVVVPTHLGDRSRRETPEALQEPARRRA